MTEQEKATRDRTVHLQKKEDLAWKKEDLARGERGKYFADDDMSLDEMVRREKMDKGTYERNAVENVGLKRKGKVDDLHAEEMEYGAGLQKSLEQFESRDKRMKTATLEDRAKRQMIDSHCKAEALHNKDRYSLENPKFPKHMLIAVATRCYLMLQTQGRLCDGHCLIVPTLLTVSTVQCDEDTLEEMRNFKKCLLQMFHQMDQDCVFFETAMGLDRMPHTYIECVPLPRVKAANAPMYFKKAINESENEFESQNKALIDTRGVRKLSSKIPKHMAYFAVEFGLQGGFAHVIENERKFPKSFGFDILAGILGVQANLVARERHMIDDERKLAQGFKATFDSFDWTKALQ